VTPKRWQTIKKIVCRALALGDAAKRRAYVSKACADSPSLRAEVESLIQREQNDHGPLRAYESLEGQMLQHYQILERIGEGAMGVAYRARDTHLDRFVVLKVLPAALIADPESQRRFVLEAQSASRLNHPNIVTVHDVAHDNGIPFIVMEYVPGRSLESMLRSGGIEIDRLFHIATQMADALAYAHAEGVVHRDLKPSNILVNPQGTVKIIDFGLAKVTAALHPSVPNGPLTNKGTLLGTAGYMAPEQVRAEAADARSDLFAFGAMLYEMLTGRPAFGGDSSIEKMNAILQDQPVDLAPTVPGLLREIVRHCLEKDRSLRFQSARDLAFALHAAQSNMAVGQSVPGSPAYGLSKWAGAVVLLLALIATLSLFGKHSGSAGSAAFRQVTFARGVIGRSRFAPDGRTIVYGAAWDGRQRDLYTTLLGFPESRALGLTGARLLAVSAKGEIALALDSRMTLHNTPRGTLARIPLSGGAPRPVVEDVFEADWTPDGEGLAVGRIVQEQQRLEFPVGRVLYTTTGYISHPRFSPKGNKIAFLDQPLRGDDRGSVAIVDFAGKKTTLSRPWETTQGLAWTPDGDEIWFAAGEAGNSNCIVAVTLSGKQRIVTCMPTGLKLDDISADGHLLVACDNYRHEMVGLAAGDTRPQNLAWLDLSSPADLSSDGKSLLFVEYSAAAGPTYAACLRKIDGSPPLRLGAGEASALSPDERWALTLLPTTPSELILWPTGPGEPKRLPVVGIDYQRGAQWVPHSSGILFAGNQAGHGVRLWVQDTATAASPHPITAEGVSLSGNSISPDGKLVAATGPDGSLGLYPIEGGAVRPLTDTSPGAQFIRWSSDGRFVYLYKPGELPAKVYRLEVASGKKQLWTEFEPLDPAGVFSIRKIVLSRDARYAVYNFDRTLSTLYVAQGLR